MLFASEMQEVAVKRDKGGIMNNRNDSIKAANEKIAFNNTIKFLADMVIKYGHLIQPATVEDIMEYFKKRKKKTA